MIDSSNHLNATLVISINGVKTATDGTTREDLKNHYDKSMRKSWIPKYIDNLRVNNKIENRLKHRIDLTNQFINSCRASESNLEKIKTELMSFKKQSELNHSLKNTYNNTKLSSTSLYKKICMRVSLLGKNITLSKQKKHINKQLDLIKNKIVSPFIDCDTKKFRQLKMKPGEQYSEILSCINSKEAKKYFGTQNFYSEKDHVTPKGIHQNLQQSYTTCHERMKEILSGKNFEGN